jgi:hypothetical protein
LEKWRDLGLWHNLSAAGGNRGFLDNFRTAFAEKGMLAIRSVENISWRSSGKRMDLSEVIFLADKQLFTKPESERKMKLKDPFQLLKKIALQSRTI